MIRLLSLIAVLSLASPLVAAQTADPSSLLRRITVTGMADVALSPDRVTVHVGILAEGRTAGEAVTRLGRDATTLFAILDAEGIAPTDRRTDGLTLREIRDPNARPEPGRVPRIVGFEAETRVAVTLTDLEDLGALLDRLVRAGANRIEGIAFGLADPEAAMVALRAAAVRDAVERATAYAAAAGVVLGPVMTISDLPGGAPAPMSRMMAAEVGVPVAPGSLTLSAEVVVSFAIRD